MDSLIRDHIHKIKSTVDKVGSLISRIKHFLNIPKDQISGANMYLHSSHRIEELTSKYFKLIKDFRLGKNDDAFLQWNQSEITACTTE